MIEQGVDAAEGTLAALPKLGVFQTRAAFEGPLIGHAIVTGEHLKMRSEIHSDQLTPQRRASRLRDIEAERHAARRFVR